MINVCFIMKYKSNCNMRKVIIEYNEPLNSKFGWSSSKLAIIDFGSKITQVHA